MGLTMVSYVDDTQLVVALSSDTKRDALKFQGDLAVVAEWMTANCLQLNASKSEVLLVGKDHGLWSEHWWPKSLGSAPPPKLVVKNLGVWLDSSLSYQVQTIKVAGTCFGLKPLLGFFDPPTRQTIIQAAIMSRLDYACSLYLGANKAEIARLQRVQNAVARSLIGVLRSCPVLATIHRLHWLPVARRIKFKALCITFKALKLNTPSILADLVTPYVPTCHLRSLGQHLVKVPRFRWVLAGGHAFRSRAPLLWNSLPIHIRSQTNYLAFRKAIKTHLFPTA